jgi:hypothetical protein
MDILLRDRNSVAWRNGYNAYNQGIGYTKILQPEWRLGWLAAATDDVTLETANEDASKILADYIDGNL